MQKHDHKTFKRTVFAAAAVLLLSGCSVTAPNQLSSDDMLRLANLDQMQMFGRQEPVTAAITMDEAVARALKYNLEHRLSMMERAISENHGAPS